METIFLLLSQSENSRLLFNFLSQNYQIKTSDQTNPFTNPVDLYIIDGVSLQQYQNELRERIACENPLFLPILFITHRQVMHRVTANLWKIVDDVLIMPIEKRELLVRIETLLRSRRLSLALKASEAALCQSQMTIEQLEEEINNLNRLFKNPNLVNLTATDYRETGLN